MNRDLYRGWRALLLCVAVFGMLLPRVAMAAPAEPSVEQALEAGDLSSAGELAREAREADPSPENWHREGKIREQQGDLAGAKAAYEGELEALPKDSTAARRAVGEDLQRVDRASRGTVADEPQSQHRAELDKQWGPTAPPPKKKAKKKAKPLPPAEPPRDRIVKKWYFWVTIVAIAASAAAVTGIAIKAARDERKDALDQQRAPNGIAIPTMIRF